MSTAQNKLVKQLTNKFLLRLFLLFNLPMGFIARLHVTQLNENSGVVSIPFYFFNKNPFKSIYFASLCMAAEFSTAVIGLFHLKKYDFSTAMLVVDMKAVFVKKATEKIYFHCEDGKLFEDAFAQTLESGEAVTVTAKTIGKTKNGEVVAEFYFTWSFKKRTKS